MEDRTTQLLVYPYTLKRYQTEKEVQWCLSERRRQTVPIIEKWT